MIDRDSRNRLAEAFRQYASGRITNDDLDAVAVDWRDKGAAAVKLQAWSLYSDLKKHYVGNRLLPRSKDRRTVARCIAFLHSDEEYCWPDVALRIRDMLWNLLMNILTLGRWAKKQQEQFKEAGDFEVWPLSSRSQLERVAKRPKLLAGLRRPKV